MAERVEEYLLTERAVVKALRLAAAISREPDEAMIKMVSRKAIIDEAGADQAIFAYRQAILNLPTEV